MFKDELGFAFFQMDTGVYFDETYGRDGEWFHPEGHILTDDEVEEMYNIWKQDL